MKKIYSVLSTFQNWKEKVAQSMLVVGLAFSFSGSVQAQIQMIYTSDSH